MNFELIKASFQKEIWEHKKTLVWVPAIIAVIMVVSPLLNLLLIENWGNIQFSHTLEQLAQVNFAGVDKFTMVLMGAIIMPFAGAAIIVQLFYFLSCLFDERRDLSVFFWRSLPVSDATTVTVKLITGAFLIPAIFLLYATALIAIGLVLFLIFCIVVSLGFDISLWSIWTHSGVFTNLALIWVNILPLSLWLFPLFAWLMLASSFANKAPFLWAIFPIVIVLLIESFMVQYLRLDHGFLLPTIQHYFNFSIDLADIDFTAMDNPQVIFTQALFGKVSVIACALGLALMYGTYWFRANKSMD